jgi:hypothetical protein
MHDRLYILWPEMLTRVPSWVRKHYHMVEDYASHTMQVGSVVLVTVTVTVTVLVAVARDIRVSVQQEQQGVTQCRCVAQCCNVYGVRLVRCGRS